MGKLGVSGMENVKHKHIFFHSGLWAMHNSIQVLRMGHLGPCVTEEGKKYVSMWYTYPLGNSDQCHLNFWSSSKFVKSNCHIVSLMMIAKKNKSAEFIWWEFFLCVETISKSLCHLCRPKAASCLYIIRYKYEIAHNVFIIFFVSIRM